MIWNDIEEARGGVNYFATVNRVHDLLARTTGQEGLARADDRDLQGRELALDLAGLRAVLGCPVVHGMLVLVRDFVRCSLERFEARNEDVGQL